MELEKAYRLLNRQLKDILATADRILNGNDSSEEIEAFARYSRELKKYVKDRIEDKEYKNTTAEIPDVNYQRNQIQIWQYFILPSWWISIVKDYEARQQTKEEINLVRGKYSSLQLLTQAQLN